MSLASPPTVSADDLIFWSGETLHINRHDKEHDEDAFEINKNDPGKGKVNEGNRRPSIYVTLCEEMVNTVLCEEAFLFSAEELALFNAFRALTYKARYLLIRLLLRKADKWHRLDSLKYTTELGPSGVEDAIKELSTTVDSALIHKDWHASMNVEDIKPKVESETLTPKVSSGAEVIDLTIDDNVSLKTEEMDDRLFGVDTKEESNADQKVIDLALNVFASDESSATLTDLLGCLTLDELKRVGKTMRLAKTTTNRAALTNALIDMASSQSTLHGFVLPRKFASSSQLPSRVGDSAHAPLRQLSLPCAASPTGKMKSKAQTDVLRELAIKIMCKCIRVNGAVRALFKRLHIVFFRSTEHPTALLTPALLARFRKRSYPAYVYKRTPSIFASRDALLAYEDALALQAEVDAMLDGPGADVVARTRRKSITASVPPSPAPRWKTPVKAGDKENTSVMLNAKTDCDIKSPGQTCHRNIGAPVPVLQDAQAEDPEKESYRIQSARRVLHVFERVYPRWQELVKSKGNVEGRSKGLERFDEGWILTRIVAKGVAAFSILKDFEREVQILEELLAQERWRRGKRGRWYERWALVLMHHLARGGEMEPLSWDEQHQILRKAMSIVVRALEDRDTHVVCRPALQRRLTRLEKRLKIPLEERHSCEGTLQKAERVLVLGVRVRNRTASIPLDRTGQVVNQAKIPSWAQVQCPAGAASSSKTIEKSVAPTPNAVLEEEIADLQKKKWTGKSIWVGKGGEHVNVETLALQHYEAQGYKGFHSEGRIIGTIFGLLFWDVLFSPVPGAFETPYQSAPLDIIEDSFYHAREDVIEARLAEIKMGRAAEILEEVDDRYRPEGTWCVGVQWETFEKQDLIEIVKCIGGEGLSGICRPFCEDYGGRTSGLPDLLVWKADADCKFVEVKGPGDSLQENQKVWIDVLLQNGVSVELCCVAEHGNIPKEIKHKAKAKVKRGANKAKTQRVFDPDDNDELEGHWVESEDECEVSTAIQQGEEPEGERPPAKRRRTG